jgi:hypothetical protein
MASADEVFFCVGNGEALADRIEMLASTGQTSSVCVI